MKKALASVMIAGAMAASLTLFGCGGQPAATEKKAETTEQTQTQTDTAQTNTTKTETKSGNQTAAGQISQEDAKRIALEDAGVKEADVTGYVKVELDTDNGVTKYDVGFHVGTTEYDYDIDATTGAILSRGSEIDIDD